MTDPERAALAQAVSQELHEFHALMAGWFNGDLPETDTALAPLIGRFTEDFEIVLPSGNRFGRQAIVDNIRSAYGNRSAQRLTIGLREIAVLEAGPHLIVCSYTEDKTTAQGTEAFRAIALLTHDPKTPSLQWRFVQETQIAG